MLASLRRTFPTPHRPYAVAAIIVSFAVTTPALVGICLGATLFLVTVAAVTCFCYRRHSKLVQNGKKGVRGGPDKPLALQQHRRPTAVKSPAGSAGTHYLKKSPSPTGGARSPPGVRYDFVNKLWITEGRCTPVWSTQSIQVRSLWFCLCFEVL